MRNQKEKILFFTNELALLIKSGLTFTKAIEIILKEEKNKKFKYILKRIHKNLTIGKNIYDSFKPFENTFESTYLYILKIGELSGNIVESLEDISKSLEFDLSRQKKLVGILIYPIVVISLTFLIVSFLLIYILPSFITIFEENQVQLPLVTRILLGISKNFHYILLFIICILTIIFIINMYINKNKYKRIRRDKFLLNIFLFGELKKLLLTSNLYHSFSVLLNAGIGMIESLEILYTNNNNYYLKDRLFEVKKAILAGNNIATSFKNLNLYNDRFSILISVGEESGYLSENFLQISKILKEDFDYKLKKLLAILEPLVILILGLIVGFVVLAIYLPILSIGDIFI